MSDVTGRSEEEIFDYENGLAAQESLSSPWQDTYLDAYRVAAMRAIDEGLGSQWLRDESIDEVSVDSAGTDHQGLLDDRGKR